MDVLQPGPQTKRSQQFGVTWFGYRVWGVPDFWIHRSQVGGCGNIVLHVLAVVLSGVLWRGSGKVVFDGLTVALAGLMSGFGLSSGSWKNIFTYVGSCLGRF